MEVLRKTSINGYSVLNNCSIPLCFYFLLVGEFEESYSTLIIRPHSTNKVILIGQMAWIYLTYLYENVLNFFKFEIMKGFKPYMMMIREVLKILNPNAFHKQVCTILESYIGLSKSRES
jgi:hypothetical protein